MKPVLDTSVTYAVALEGGGARGAYEIGVWRALDEAGIRFNAVSGTSVGALNGALFAMGDRAVAEDAWLNIKMSDVVDPGRLTDEELKDIVSGKLDHSNLLSYLPALRDILINRGLDASPLRRWLDEVLDYNAIKTGGCALYITTVNISDRKPLQVRINDMTPQQMGDMLFASAYHPAFRSEKLGGKLYADGGFIDSTPVYPLLKDGYKNIIAVHLPTLGMVRPLKFEDDVTVTPIRTEEDLGAVLNFDAKQSALNMEAGYYDAMRVIYGLHGKRYAIERTMTEREALDGLIDMLYAPQGSLRQVIDELIPLSARKHAVGKGASFYEIFIPVLEECAEVQNLPRRRIVTDAQLLSELKR